MDLISAWLRMLTPHPDSLSLLDSKYLPAQSGTIWSENSNFARLGSSRHSGLNKGRSQYRKVGCRDSTKRYLLCACEPSTYNIHYGPGVATQRIETGDLRENMHGLLA